MNQLRKFVQGLSLRHRISLSVTAVLVFAALYVFTRWNHERNFKPLYSDLSTEDAGAVIAKLKESGVEYRFGGNNSTLLVPSGKIPELRLQMASAGIPKSGRIGYELFDRTNLGTTDFAEQVNYHRAVEGELERSIMSMNEVSQARVHITFPKDSVFTENRLPAKASVLVKLKPGAHLSMQNAQALTQLVASAVEGLTPESISVMDMQGNLLIRPKKPGDGSEPSEEYLVWKKQMEATTLAKINSVLDPLLGSEKYRASVDLDCDQTSGEQSEETFDPTHSVITNSQRTEEGSISRDTAGVPGTQSNLPRPTMRTSVNGGGVARRTENMNYETSRTVRKMKLPQGIVRRMSISVLVDQNVKWEAAKTKGAWPNKILQAPSAGELKVIHDVVAAAAGFNTTRGDQLTVDTLPFEATLHAHPPTWMTPPASQNSGQPTKPWTRAPVLLGAVVLLLLGLMAAMLLGRSRKRARTAIAELQKQLEAAQLAREEQGIVAVDGSHSGTETGDAGAQNMDEHEKQIAGIREAFKLPPMTTTKTEVLTNQVMQEAQKDPVALAQIIRSWLSEEK
ncbi:MAG TPA: flagellar basal-body MS-ring/collar protein FliF [Bryobacteraceae bacterium]|nr:flagellar basal-body MS-ring/collar protein FliF [Bryobacteraceae bacterium]